MRCPSCSADNPRGARFCGSCGQRLTVACPHCGAGLTADLRYCTSCGGAVGEGLADDDAAAAESAGQAPSERRLVSVLFVDLEGFTSLVEEMDPEDVRSLQAAYFEAARAVIARYGGTLEKFVGDAVMAVWGTPTAHEDDAERAVRAALELVAVVPRLRGPDAERALSARAAVATGEAAVTLGAEGQGIVAGDLVNTAARLQAVAPSNRVIVDEATRRAAVKGLRFESSGRVSLRGRTGRPAVWLAHAGLPARREATKTAHGGPFVGRQRELGELLDLFRRSATERRLRLVSIIGIAGIGKSRLLWELERALDAADEPVALHVGRAPSYGDGITFAPLAEMVRRRAEIGDNTDAEIARRQLAATLAEFVHDAAERRWIEPRLAALIDPTTADSAPTEELFAAWRRFFEHVSGWTPTLLVFEDVQWAQSQMLDFIEHLASWSRDHPIMVIVLFRPELLDARPTWPAGVHSYTALQLDPLAADDIRRLLAGLVPDLAPALVERIVQHAGGVPLYAVEVTRMLLDRESRPARVRDAPPEDGRRATIEVPDTLRSLVAARLDALPPAERELVHAAAVLGRRFDGDVLAALAGLPPSAAGARIAALVRRQLLAIDDDLGSPGRGELSFVQDAVRDVAYRTLSRRERRKLHLAAADHLERLRPEQLVEAQAEHLYAAHAAAVEDDGAPLIAARAVAALAAAAQRAMAVRVPERALELLERAISLAGEDDARVELWEEAALAARAAARFDVAERLLRQTIEFAEARADRLRAARSRAQLASILLSVERHWPAIGDLEKALSDMAALGAAGSDAVTIELLGQLARASVLVGDNAKAIEQAQRALEAARAADQHALAIDALITLGTARVRRGNEARGLADLRAAISEARERGIVRVELRARNNLAWLLVLDDPRAALDVARAGMELAVDMGIGDMALQLTEIFGAVAIDTGDWDDAIARIEEAQAGPHAPAHLVGLRTTEAIIRGLRGERAPAGMLKRLETAADTDAQVGAAIDLARAWLALLAGRLEECVALADAAAQASVGADAQSALVLAARAALWSRDERAAAGHTGRLTKLRLRGRAADAYRLTLEAGVSALRGDEEAAARYDAAVGSWHELRLPLALGLCLAERHVLLRHRAGDSDARDDLRAAERILDDLGARGALRAIRRLARRPSTAASAQ